MGSFCEHGDDSSVSNKTRNLISWQIFSV